MNGFIYYFHNEDNLVFPMSFPMTTSHLHTHCTSLNSDRGAPIKCHTAIAFKHRYYVYIFLQWQNNQIFIKCGTKMYNDG